MYTPRQIKTDEIQIGGQTQTYIDMDALKQSVSSMSIPSLSSVQYILSTANLRTIEAISSITTDQLKSLIDNVDKQIAVDYSSISDIQTKITSTQIAIDGPYGLFIQYTSKKKEYDDALNTYNSQSTAAAIDMATYLYDISTLSTLRTQSTMYASTLISYRNEYDRILSSIQQNASTVQNYEQQYRGFLSSISSNNILYKQGLSSLSTISSIVYSDLTALNNPANIAIRTQLSSTYVVDLFSYNQVSTNVNKYVISDLSFKSSISTLYRYLYSTLQISSFDMLSSDTYYSTIEYYSRLEQTTISTINYYNSQISSLISDISYLSSQKLINYSTLQIQIADISRQQGTYYSYLKQALEAECDEYAYGIQQYNSQIGYITASLGIIVNNIASLNDSINIQNLDPNIPETTKSFNRDRQATYTSDTSIIISIINSLNILDTAFGNIITYVATEKGYKDNFIDMRQSILTTYEIPALSFTTQAQLDSIKTNYINKFSDLNNIIVNINLNIKQRNDTLYNINSVISPLKANINKYFNTYLAISADQLPDVLTQVRDDTPPLPAPPELPTLLGGSIMPSEPKEPTSDSIYSFIPPIDFNPGF
jgi:hypothetical protein